MLEFRKITVFGGSGYLGTALVRELQKNGGYTIIIVDTHPPSPDVLVKENTQYYNLDILSASLKTISKVTEKSDTVFFKIGKLGDPSVSSKLSAGWDFLQTNAFALHRIMPVLIDNDVKRIIVDSSITAVADFSKSDPISENASHGVPTNFYGLSKAILEDLCKSINLNGLIQCTIIRYPRVYIPNQHNFLNSFASDIAKNIPIKIFGNVDKLIDLVHIDDATEVAVSCLNYVGEYDVFHAAYNRALTLRKIVELCRKYISSN